MDKLPEISRIMFVGFNELVNTDGIEESTTIDTTIETPIELLNNND